MSAINPAALLFVAAALCAVTAVIHSVLGEKRLIGPILSSGIPLMDNLLARNVTRFAWHWTSALWLCVAVALVLIGQAKMDAPILLLTIGITHVVAGIGDAILTKGKHVGWPFITLIGVLVLLSYFANNT